MRQKTLFLIILLLAELLLAAGTGLAKARSVPPARQEEKGKAPPVIVPREERSTLAVLKFTNTSSQEKGARYQPWEYGIAAMLTTDLEETAMFNLVDRMRLNDVLREHSMQQAGLTDPATALAVGKLVTARYILTGTFMVEGQDLRINVQVFSVERGIQLGAASASGRVDRFFLVEKEIFNKTTRVLQVMLDEEKKARILSAVETKSVDASLNNYSGETALMQADELKKKGSASEAARLVNFARQKFEEALRYDPDYERAKVNISRLVIAIPMTL